MQLARVCAGTFEVGWTWDESDESAAIYPASSVTLTHDFMVATTEVTQAEYEAVAGSNPSSFPDCGSDCPVETLSWHMAADYANALSEAEGLTQCYSCTTDGSLSCGKAMGSYECDGYRMLTLAEGEVASRCGENLLYAGSDDLNEVGWHEDNSGGTPHPVARKAPNACGLYDMSGNVWEWTQNWYDESERPSGIDPEGLPEEPPQSFRFTRSGSYELSAGHHAVHFAYGDAPVNQRARQGVRLARTVY